MNTFTPRKLRRWFAFFAILLIILHQPHQSFARRRLVAINVDADGLSQTDGVCSLAVRSQGYNCEEFEVQTDDGYIISIQRIPQGRAGGNGTSGPPVLLQHGVLVDGLIWLLSTPEQSLAYILADNGFDVWVSNIRGTQFSRRHVRHDSKKKIYWNWSWDDLITYELPPVINLIFQKTGQKIHYVGHSLGTLIAMASFSEGLHIDKVKSAVLLSPIAYLSHMQTPLGVSMAKSFVGEMTINFGLSEFNPKSKLVEEFLVKLCELPGMDCYDLLTAITGENCCLNASNVDLFLEYEPQSTSTKNLVHLSQTARDGVLRKYDYGKKNKEHYGKDEPPSYDLSKIPHDLPIFLSHGGKDALSDVKDVQILLDLLLKAHHLDKLQVQFIKDYAHADFVIGTTAKDVVYNEVVKFLRRFN